MLMLLMFMKGSKIKGRKEKGMDPMELPPIWANVSTMLE